MPIDDRRLATTLRTIWSLPASLAILAADLPANWRLAFGLAVGGYLIGGWALHWRQRGAAPVRVVCGADGHWTLLRSQASPVRGRLVNAWGVMHGPVIGLRWVINGGATYEAWVVKWITPPRSWRHLRTRLRLS